MLKQELDKEPDPEHGKAEEGERVLQQHARAEPLRRPPPLPAAAAAAAPAYTAPRAHFLLQPRHTIYQKQSYSIHTIKCKKSFSYFVWIKDIIEIPKNVSIINQFLCVAMFFNSTDF